MRVFILLHLVLLEKIAFRFIRAAHFVLPDLCSFVNKGIVENVFGCVHAYSSLLMATEYSVLYFNIKLSVSMLITSFSYSNVLYYTILNDVLTSNMF